MLAKLLKHDFKSLFKYWWIAAIVSLGLGVLAGFCFPIITSEADSIPDILRVSAVLGFLVAIIGIGVFSVFSIVMIFIRFYKNLFTDEGYLTFTLPVKRASILNSKLISAVLFTFATYFVIFLSIGIALIIGLIEEDYLVQFFQNFSKIVNVMIEQTGVYFFIYVLEAAVLMAATLTLSTLFLFVCITLASVIAKKARVILALGIYYGVTSVCTSLLQILLIFSVSNISQKLSNLTESAQQAAGSGILLCVILFVILLCGVLYALEYYMLDRKLNLL